MDKEDVIGFVRRAVPWIGAAATGNVPALITMAAEAVSGALGVEVPANGPAITQAIAGATPDQILALRQAEHAFVLRMREFDYKEVSELATGAYADMASARERDVQITTVTGKTNSRASIMLASTMGALIALVTVMLVKDIDANTALGGVVLLLIGKFSNAWDTAFQFEFGTNRASRTKDDTINTLTKGPTP